MKPLIQQSLKIFVESIPQSEFIQIQEITKCDENDGESCQILTDLVSANMERWVKGLLNNECPWYFDIPSLLDIPTINHSDIMELVSSYFEECLNEFSVEIPIDIECHIDYTRPLAEELVRYFNTIRNNEKVRAILTTPRTKHVLEIQTLDEMISRITGDDEYDNFYEKYLVECDDEFFQQIENRYNKFTDSGYDTDKTTELY